MNTLVWITFPTVDIVNPEEDEVIERLARALHERGLKGEFIFSGVKVQSTLVNRPATIEYLNTTGMTIGYQGNAHSLHPGLMEYEERCEWEDGVVEATHRESQWLNLDGTTDPARRGGILLLQDTFGERFAGFRGAGGWTPQVMEVLRRSGIGVHHTLFDMAEATGCATASYLGCLQVSPGRSKWTGQFPYASPMTNRIELEQIVRLPDQGADRLAETFQRMTDNYCFRGPRILFINFHPFFLFTDTVADVMNYSNGRMPDPPQNWVRSNLLAPADMQRRWEVVTQIFDWLSTRSDVACVTSVDLAQLARAIVPTLQTAEIEALAREVAALPLMRPPAFVRLEGKALSLSEAFDVLQRSLVHQHLFARLPQQIETRVRLGPADLPSSATERTLAASVEEVVEAALGCDGSSVPTEITLAGGPVAPYPFLVAMARALLWRDDPRRAVLVRPTDFAFPELADSFTVYLRRCADWEIYRRHLDPSRLAKHASLQLWTYRPVESLGGPTQ